MKVPLAVQTIWCVHTSRHSIGADLIVDPNAQWSPPFCLFLNGYVFFVFFWYSFGVGIKGKPQVKPKSILRTPNPLTAQSFPFHKPLKPPPPSSGQWLRLRLPAALESHPRWGPVDAARCRRRCLQPLRGKQVGACFCFSFLRLFGIFRRFRCRSFLVGPQLLVCLVGLVAVSSIRIH